MWLAALILWGWLADEGLLLGHWHCTDPGSSHWGIADSSLLHTWLHEGMEECLGVESLILVEFDQLLGEQLQGRVG